MPEKPVIIVQIVHIEGPLKGKIQEYDDPIIQIGRQTDCQLGFPKDLTVVSRNHAEIVREGNRFKLVDHSTNGTFVNGKAVKEQLLKDGDVLMIGNGGPKVSFLSEIKATGVEVSQSAPGMPQSIAFSSPPPAVTPRPSSAPEETPPGPPPDRLPTPSKRSLFSGVSAEQTPAMVSRSPRATDPAEVRVQAPLVIQFGPTIQSFKMLPVIIGKNADCDFILNHAGVIDRHLQVFFHENNYWVKDLTGQDRVTLNDTPIRAQTPLNPGSQLSLGPQGPVFQFLSGGRLAEVTDQPTEKTDQESMNTSETPWESIPKTRHRSKGPLIYFIGFMVVLIVVTAWLFLNSSTTDTSITGGLNEWWHRVMKAIQRIAG